MILVAIFVPLERIFAVHPQKVLRKGIVTDLGYYFLSSLLPALLLGAPLGLLAWVVHQAVPSGIHAATAALPLWARVFCGLVAGEIGYYWGHRWSHEIPFLWRFHSIHHSAEEVNFLVSSRAHPVDMVFGRFCGTVPLYVLGLGGPEALADNQVPALVALIGIIWGFFIHANLRWRIRAAGMADLHPRIPPLAPHPERTHQPQLRLHLALARLDLRDPLPAPRCLAGGVWHRGGNAGIARRATRLSAVYAALRAPPTG